MSKPVPTTRADYPHFLSIDTRWSDNDLYGHVNNVVYYSYFDTVVNEYLIRARRARSGSRQDDRARGRDALQLLRSAGVS